MRIRDIPEGGSTQSLSLRWISANRTSGSAMRPVPVCRQLSQPSAGCTKSTPSSPSWRMFRCTEGFFPHHVVHGGRQQDRTVTAKVERTQQIVCHSCRCLGNKIGGRGGDAEQFRPLSQLDVRTEGVLAIRKDAGTHRSPGECREGCCAHKFTRGASHHHRDPCPRLHQLAHQRGRFVGRDSASHTNEYFTVLHMRFVSKARTQPGSIKNVTPD